MKRLLKPFTVLLLLLTGMAILVTCKKEYSYEGGPLTSNAVFSYLGAGSACTNSVVKGSYYTGSALADTNNIALQVHVDSIGAYIINTSTANGITFSGSGSFTDTGLQTITLIGIGTPAAAGSYSFNTPGGDTSCSFTVLVTAKPILYAGFTLIGDPGACSNTQVNGQYIRGQALTPSNTVIVNVNVSSVGAFSITTDTLDGISFSALGTFTTTGALQVTLIGSGTPSDPKNLHFKVSGNNTGCTIDIAVVNPEPLATYVIESGVGPDDNPFACVVSGATGDYTAGTPLSGTNTVPIRVTATVVGNFTISSDEVNGMIFSYTGTFTDVGTQFVTLVGSGTPTMPGTFVITPKIVGPAPIGGTSCGFKVGVK